MLGSQLLLYHRFMANRRLDLEQRKSIVTWNAEGNNVRQILDLFAVKYRREAPDKRTITKLLTKWNEHNTIENRHKGNSGRRRTTRTVENIEVVSDVIENDHHLSINRISRMTGISHYGVWTILKNDLDLYPYKRSTIIALTDQDKQRRLHFCADFQRVEQFIEDIWFSDEAHFLESGYQNSLNYREYATENPHYHVEKTSYPRKTTFWCAINVHGVYGININQNVDGAVYRDIVRDHFVPFLRRIGRYETAWFMQDGASPHTSIQSTDLLREHFGDRVIALRFPERYHEGISWPPKSPDLNPCDYFWWGTTKDLIYKDPPRSINALIGKFEDVVMNIPQEQIRNAILSLPRRLAHCRRNNGGAIHFD